MRERNKKPLYLIITLFVILVGLGAYFFIGKQRIISPVPESAQNTERVILVTPQATPTGEYQSPTPTPEEEEASPTPEEEEEPTKKPTPTTAEEEPTATPTPEETAQ